MIAEPYPEKWKPTPEERTVLVRALGRELNSVSRTVSTLERAARVDPAGWAQPNMAYYKNARGYLEFWLNKLTAKRQGGGRRKRVSTPTE